MSCSLPERNNRDNTDRLSLSAVRRKCHTEQ